MFLKIRMRSILLSIYENCGFETNPYSLNPYTHYIYYESLNRWLKYMKKARTLSAEQKVVKLIEFTHSGYDAEKLYAQVKTGQSYKLSDFVDEQLVEEIESLSDEDTRNGLYGAAIVYSS